MEKEAQTQWSSTLNSKPENLFLSTFTTKKLNGNPGVFFCRFVALRSLKSQNQHMKLGGHKGKSR